MKTLIAAVCALVLALPAAAGPGEAREDQQQARIRDGVVDGELTRGEARGLRKDQRRVDGLQRKARKDGVVTRKEAKRVDRAQDHASRQIGKQKHDRQTR